MSILIVVCAISNKSTIHRLPPNSANVFFLEEKTSINPVPAWNNKHLRRQEGISQENFSRRNKTPARSNAPDIVAPAKDIFESKDISSKEKAIGPQLELIEKTQNKYSYISSQEHNKTSGSISDFQEKTSPSSKDLSNKDTGGNNFSDVLSKIRAAIEKAKNYPAIARNNGIEGTVLTEFSIGTDGLPVNIKIIKSSGFNVLDSAALQTINKASPFPAIKGSLEIPITFVLKK